MLRKASGIKGRASQTAERQSLMGERDSMNMAKRLSKLFQDHRARFFWWMGGVESTMLLCVALCLLPLSPTAEALHATAIVRALIAACGVWGLASVSGTASTTSAVGGKKAAPLKRSQSPGKKAGKKSQ